MHSAVKDMLQKYQSITSDDYRNALKEIIQEIALLGLYRGNFFDKASFYGGSALRIFYGLDRFSEDLDFSLDEVDPVFTISPYCTFIQDELNSFGFDVSVERKDKKGISTIESAFIKAGTQIHFLKIGLKSGILSSIANNESLKIKLEIDTSPPGKVEHEVKYQLNPIPYHVRIYALPFLFAGKVHALLYRQWGGHRVKGRDLYDYVWYLSRGVSLNIRHLQERMQQTGYDISTEPLSRTTVLELLMNKFSRIDYKQAQKDVFPFIKNNDTIAIWSKEFFQSITKDKLIVSNRT